MEVLFTEKDIRLLTQKLNTYRASAKWIMFVYPVFIFLCLASWLYYWHGLLIFLFTFFLLASSTILAVCYGQINYLQRDLNGGIKIQTTIRISSKEIINGNEIVHIPDEQLKQLLLFQQENETSDKSSIRFTSESGQTGYSFMISGKDETNTFVRYRIPLEYFVQFREGQTITLYYTPTTITVLEISSQ